jgi:plasmid stabilization system protein ParE
VEKKIAWNKRPAKYLQKQLKRISEDSFIQAERIEEGILTAVENTKINPERHPKDKFKQENDGTFRAFEIFSFRVAYRFTEKEIRILRIRHVKQEPKDYR